MPTDTTQATDTTVRKAFEANSTVQSSLDAVIEELCDARSQLTGVRGPNPDAKAENDQLLADAAQSRGRGLYYPYIGSGVGNGPLVELADGSVKYDMICGIGVNFFGHSDTDLIRTALGAVTSDVVMQGNLQMNGDAIRFSKTLLEQASRKSNLAHAFLCNSGVMANESALKVCFQKHVPASRVIVFEDCFMGRSWTMAQLGDNAAARAGLPLNVLVDYMPFYNDAAARDMNAGDVSGQTRFIDMAVSRLEQYIARHPKQHACFVFELLQGEGGFRRAPREFHVALMEVCKANDIAVWADEVQTFGRTEQMFCFESLDVGNYLDVCTIGKMTQVCAAMYTAEYNPKPGLLSGTFLGSTVGLRVGQRIIERLRDGDYYGDSGSNAKHFNLFCQGVRAIAAKHPEWFPQCPGVADIVSGMGGMMRFTPFGGKREQVIALCNTLYDEGVITFYCGHGPFHVRMLPPLGVMRDEDWTPVFEIVERAMAKQAATA
jgi:4-aminobutyrate aminotransferase-like enzyme